MTTSIRSFYHNILFNGNRPTAGHAFRGFLSCGGLGYIGLSVIYRYS